jgi:Lrp/AsnC family transcriptional regulator
MEIAFAMKNEKPIPLDTIDYRILRALQKAPESSTTEIARIVGLTHTPCWRRLGRLEKTGYIAGRAVLLDAARMGLKVNVFVKLRLGRHDEFTLDALEQAASERAEIVECFSLSGECDYQLRVVVSSVEEYEQFLRKVLLHLPGVTSVTSCFALKCVKLTTNLPI